MKRIIYLILIFLFLCSISYACAAELTVDPSGINGDFTSITKALQAAQDGDTLLLYSGVYAEPQETFPIEITKQVKLKAVDGADVIMDGPPFLAIFRVTAPDVSLQGITLNLRRWGIVALADGLSLVDNKFVLIDPAHRVSSCGVWLAGIKNVVVRGNQFTGCSACLAGPPLSERSSTLPVLTGLFEVGEDIEFFTTHVFENNIVNNKPLYYYVGEQEVIAPTDAGQFIAVDCERVLIDGLNVSDGSMGLITAHCGYVELCNTKADRCGIFGTYLAHVSRGVLNNVTCLETNHGIDIRGSQNITVQNCHTVDCDQGIFLSMSDDCLVIDCTARGSGNGYFLAVGHNNRVIRCQAIDNENGFRGEKENNISFIDNYCEGNTVVGIRLDRSSASAVGNEFKDNWVGIMAYGQVLVDLNSNHFDGSISCGMYIRDLIGGTLVNNTVEQSQSGCVSLQMEMNLGDMIIDSNSFDKEVIDHTEK